MVARDVRPAHVDDVFVLIANFLDGERNNLEPHLVHVVRTSGTHAVADHLWLLHDFFDRQLPDDSAQMAFHDQLNQAFALLIALRQELFSRGPDRLHIRFHFNLRHGLDGHCDTLLCVEILLWSDVE